MGKSLDKRLQELGGERLLALACADEATNMEEVVSNWQNLIIEVLVKLSSSNVDKSVSAVSGESSNCAGATLCESLKMMGKISDGILSVQQILPIILRDSNSVDSPPPVDTLPKAKSVDGPFEIFSHALDLDSSPVAREWSAESPFEAKVVHARWLSKVLEEVSSSEFSEGKTKWGEGKRVIHMELDLGDSGISYQPGDSVGICCPNPQYAIDFILERLNLALEPSKKLCIDQFVKTEKFGTLLIQDLLAYRYGYPSSNYRILEIRS